MRRLYDGLKLYYNRFSSRNGPGIFHNSANNRQSWSRKSDCVTLGKLYDDMLSHTRRKNSLGFKSAFCNHSAVCSLHFVLSLHFVSGLHSAFCTNKYPWHQYSLFLITVIRTTHTIIHHFHSMSNTFSMQVIWAERHSGKMIAHAWRISRFRGVISDSSVSEVCWRTHRTSFYTFWDYYWCDPTGKFFNGVCSYGKIWRVSRIFLDIVQLKLI